MTESHRLESLTPTPTIPRQTPHRDFGSLLAEGLGSVFSRGAAVVSRAFGAVPLLSSAVASVPSVGSLASVKTSPLAPAATSVRGVSIAASAGSVGGLDSPWVQDLLARLEAGGELNPSEYLVLQRAMQQENQQYTAASNILKVRADSAKAAINNIR